MSNHHRRGIAPPELIRLDFKALDSQETLRTTWPIEQLILIQSVQGHAHEGHGTFRGQRFVNTTMDIVTEALRLDPAHIKADRQALIDSISRWVDRALSPEPPLALVDEESEPLLGISTLRFLRVEPKHVLRGIYLGGLRDNSEVRLQVEKERGIKIGGGKLYLVDLDRVDEMHLNCDALAHGEWANDIERFKREGLIVGQERRNDANISYEYIRHRRGPGASDDGAIVAAGFMWGLGVSVGVFLADAIDTLEKYVPVYGDQDEDIALKIGTALGDAGKPSMDEVKLLTYLAASPEDAEIDVPDSSLRHLLRVDRHHDLCAVEAHFLAVQSLPAPSIPLAHERTNSGQFYEWLRGRVATAN